MKKNSLLFLALFTGAQLFASTSDLPESNEVTLVIVKDGKLYDKNNPSIEVQRLGRELCEYDFLGSDIDYALVPKAKMLSVSDCMRTVTRQFDAGTFVARENSTDPKLPEPTEPVNSTEPVRPPAKGASSVPQPTLPAKGVSGKPASVQVRPPVKGKPVVDPAVVTDPLGGVTVRSIIDQVKKDQQPKSYKQKLDMMIQGHKKTALTGTVGSGLALLVVMTYPEFKKTLSKNNRLSYAQVAKRYFAFLGKKLQKDPKCMAVAALTLAGGSYTAYVVNKKSTN